ncbi:uncharacterized protein J7T55_009421 [Diaporthe amygdali]|uniref:uncharacterized protein n=1 Tax=Phomopsis amygdali TaxID=1214568 RepID=UPI0022FE288F|nr:uncharacterized protein J7T55_009421 [Diaporthe amygdali]KAJ0104257.1 uncharacterized protein J7T55_009421 [Diaporthe amygdali]
MSSSLFSKYEIPLPDSGQKLLILVLAACCIPIVYSITLHPLARVPGPFLAKLSDLWHAYHLSTGTRHILLCDLHNKYEQGLHKIFSGSSPIEKSPFYKAFAPGFPSSFAAVGDAFKQKKSILSHAFAQKKLDAMEVTFMEHTMKLYEAMVAQKVVDLDQALSALTIDILSDVCFGETFDLIHNPAEKARVSDGLVQAAKWVSLEGTIWRWPLLQKIVRALSNKFTTRQYPAQKRNASRREDIFNYLLTAQKPETGEPFPDPELFGEAIILFVAGSDTTSTALLTTLWHLISHKETYKTLAEEIRSKFSSIDDITYQEAQHLPYLRAVIEEGLRIFPPNSGFIPRQVIDSPRPFTLHDVVIPPGVQGLAWEEPLLLELDMEFQDPLSESRKGYTPTDSFVLVRPHVRVLAKRRSKEECA